MWIEISNCKNCGAPMWVHDQDSKDSPFDNNKGNPPKVYKSCECFSPKFIPTPMSFDNSATNNGFQFYSQNSEFNAPSESETITGEEATDRLVDEVEHRNDVYYDQLYSLYDYKEFLNKELSFVVDHEEYSSNEELIVLLQDAVYDCFEDIINNLPLYEPKHGTKKKKRTVSKKPKSRVVRGPEVLGD